MHPGRKKKLLVLSGVKKKKKRKGNGPLINDSNCSKLIEYIIHRHPHHPLPAAISTSSMVNDMRFGYHLCALVCYHPPHPTVFMKHKGRLWLVSVCPIPVLHNLCLYVVPDQYTHFCCTIAKRMISIFNPCHV